MTQQPSNRAIGESIQIFLWWISFFCTIFCFSISADASIRPLTGGELSIELHSEELTLDPLSHANWEERWIQSVLYEPLFYYHNRTLKSSFFSDWASDNSYKHWTFTIKSCDRPFNPALSHDYVEKNISRIVKRSYQWDFYTPFTDLLGAMEFFKGETNTISGFVCNDGSHIQLHFIRPHPYLLTELTLPSAAMVGEPDELKSPFHSGTGPYTALVQEREGAPSTELVMNSLSLRGFPFIQKITVKLINNNQKRGTKSEDPEVLKYALPVDIEGFSPVRSKNDVQNITDLKINRIYNVTVFLQLNPNRSLFESHKFRQAVSACIDRQSIAAVLFAGNASVADTIVDSSVEPFSSLLSGEHSREQESVATAEENSHFLNGSAKPKECTILFPQNSPSLTKVAERIQVNLLRNSFNVLVEPLAEKELEARRREGNFDAILSLYVPPGNRHYINFIEFLQKIETRETLKQTLETLFTATTVQRDDERPLQQQCLTLEKTYLDNFTIVPIIHSYFYWYHKASLMMKKTSESDLPRIDALWFYPDSLRGKDDTQSQSMNNSGEGR